MKRIALLYSGANPERQREKIKELHNSFKRRGDAVYVLSCYDAISGNRVPVGDQYIYTLAHEECFDGCVIDDNINTDFTQNYLIDGNVLENKPCVFYNAKMDKFCTVGFDTYESVYEMLEHLITVHGCRKINYVANFAWLAKRYKEYDGVRAYRDVCDRYGISFDENRLVTLPVSMERAGMLPLVFDSLGVGDCDAVFCNADINAIGLCNAYIKQGVRVPEDVKIVALRRSGNSAGFKPDISGGVFDETIEAETIAKLLYDNIEGKVSNDYRTFKVSGEYGESCGCCKKMRPFDEERCRINILNKISSGDQISAMMTFGNSLEKVTSIEEYAQIIKQMYKSLGCKNYAICINKEDIPYIMHESMEDKFDPKNPFGDTLYVVAGKRGEEDLDGTWFERKDISPFEVKAGDIVTIMPITHLNRTFGYTVLYNDLQPYELFNYRICYETLGSSIENLRRKFILSSTIRELDELRIRDPLTGLYNRASIQRFEEKLVASKTYTVVMLDMDNLKKINDVYGHEEGNRAIKLTAKEIEKATKTEDYAIRYGGDEFVVLCPGDFEQYWNKMRDEINESLKEVEKEQKIPYELGISIGYAVHTADSNSKLSNIVSLADESMYENKQKRKKGRQA